MINKYYFFTPFYADILAPSLCQTADVQAQVSQNTEALQGAQMEMSDLSRQIQNLEIELASQQSLVSMHLKTTVFHFLVSFIFI